MFLTILAMVIVGMIGILVGMIIETAFENNSRQEPEQVKDEELEIIEINDPDNYFLPF